MPIHSFAATDLVFDHRKLGALLVFPTEQLPLARLRPSPVDLEELVDSPHPYLREMAEQALQRDNGIKNALDVIASEFEFAPLPTLKRWCQANGFAALASALAQLPVAAAEGTFKFKGYLPTRIDESAATRYAALLLLMAVRAIFFGERRGLGQIVGGIEARGWRYARVLPEDSALVVSGFMTLSEHFSDLGMATVLRSCAQRTVDAVHPEDRPVAALAITYSLLVSAGRSALAKNPQLLLKFAS
jgi:hypothetical protein